MRIHAGGRLFAVALVICSLVKAPDAFASDDGIICVSPAGNEQRTMATPGLACEPSKLKVKIDNREAVLWPHKDSLKVSGLDVASRHTVRVFCGSRQQQSFSFRLADYKSKKVCLFLNDLYWTVQLWEDKQCPWCRCKD